MVNLANFVYTKTLLERQMWKDWEEAELYAKKYSSEVERISDLNYFFCFIVF